MKIDNCIRIIILVVIITAYIFTIIGKNAERAYWMEGKHRINPTTHVCEQWFPPDKPTEMPWWDTCK